MHNPPFSTDVPKIRFILEDTIIYNSEVIDGSIKTYEGDIDDPDIAISTTKKEVIQAMLAKDMTGFMKDSVANGKTNIDMLASQIELASKGYLQMYNDIASE